MTHVPSSPEFWLAETEAGKSPVALSRLVSAASAGGFVLALFAIVIVGLQIAKPWMLIGYIATIGLLASSSVYAVQTFEKYMQPVLSIFSTYGIGHDRSRLGTRANSSERNACCG